MADEAALIAGAQALFKKRHGRDADLAILAPGRVNLIGEHMDYNDGLVLPMAINRSIALIAGKREEGSDGLRVFSADLDQEVSIDYAVADPAAASGWAAYLVGVVALCQKLGMQPAAMDVVLVSNLPHGAGLSSSAALEVAFATLLETACRSPMDPWQKIRLCQQAENDYAGMPCGIMDQATVVLAKAGHLLLLDCDTLVTRDVPFDDPNVSVLIIDSRVKHQLVDSPFAQRRQQCEDAAAILGKRLRALTMHELDARREELDAVNFRRARHVVGEITRTADAVDAIAARNWELAGELMTASHASLRDDFEVSCSEVDALVNTCEALGMKAGVYGARITGGGFGGCVVALVETNQVAEIEAAISAAYRVETGLQAEFIHALPMAGARCVDDCRRD